MVHKTNILNVVQQLYRMVGYDSHHRQHLYSTLTKQCLLSHHGKVSAVKLSTKSRGNHIKAV